MPYLATIIDALETLAPPLWESPELPTADEAYAAAETEVHATQPDDQIEPDGHGRYVIFGAADDDGHREQLASILITQASDGH